MDKIESELQACYAAMEDAFHPSSTGMGTHGSICQTLYDLDDIRDRNYEGKINSVNLELVVQHLQTLRESLNNSTEMMWASAQARRASR